MAYKNPEDAKAYERARKKRITLERKTILSEFSCICCGDPDDTVIQWHHVEPKNKLFYVLGSFYSETAWWDEVMKCIPVCANCHLKIHKNKLCLIPPKLR